MLSEKMCAALNEQITKEFYSSYLYLQMAAWCDEQSLTGFGNWMRIQTQEENAHGMILFNYVLERGGSIKLGQIETPVCEYDSLLDVFEATLKHEQFVTSSFNNLMGLAIAENDYACKIRLDWFIEEQVEEEANVGDIIGKLKLIGTGSNGLFMMDKEMASRSYVVPSPLAGA